MESWKIRENKRKPAGLKHSKYVAAPNLERFMFMFVSLWMCEYSSADDSWAVTILHLYILVFLSVF